MKKNLLKSLVCWQIAEPLETKGQSGRYGWCSPASTVAWGIADSLMALWPKPTPCVIEQASGEGRSLFCHTTAPTG